MANEEYNKTFLQSETLEDAKSQLQDVYEANPDAIIIVEESGKECIIEHGKQMNFVPSNIDLPSEVKRIATLESEISGKADTEALAAKADLSDVEAITAMIPTQATAQNQLADKNFVNSSIATNTADFKGTFQSLEEAETIKADANDYLFVATKDDEGNDVYKRYKYVEGAGWVFEYDLNNSSFTAAQWAAIQSGITAELVAAISKAASKEELKGYLPLTGGTVSGQITSIVANGTAPFKVASKTKVENLLADEATGLNILEHPMPAQYPTVKDVKDRIVALSVAAGAGRFGRTIQIYASVVENWDNDSAAHVVGPQYLFTQITPANGESVGTWLVAGYSYTNKILGYVNRANGQWGSIKWLMSNDNPITADSADKINEHWLNDFDINNCKGDYYEGKIFHGGGGSKWVNVPTAVSDASAKILMVFRISSSTLQILSSSIGGNHIYWRRGSRSEDNWLEWAEVATVANLASYLKTTDKAASAAVADKVEWVNVQNKTNATVSADGLMSATDKQNLDKLSTVLPLNVSGGSLGSTAVKLDNPSEVKAIIDNEDNIMKGYAKVVIIWHGAGDFIIYPNSIRFYSGESVIIAGNCILSDTKQRTYQLWLNADGSIRSQAGSVSETLNEIK